MPTAVPPFLVGDKIVRRDNPAAGSLIVTDCEPCAAGDGWLVGADGAGLWTSAPAEGFVLAPDGWREPAPLPRLGDFYNPSSAVPPDTLAEQVAGHLARAEWMEQVGALVNPDCAREAAGLRRMAAMLREDAQ